MENVPDHGAHEVRVVIDPEDAVVRIQGQGCCVVLEGIEAMRAVHDSLGAHIALLTAEQHEASAGYLPLVGQSGLQQLYQEHVARHSDDRVKWFQSGGDAA